MTRGKNPTECTADGTNRCGNGEREEGYFFNEQCDDGDTDPGDGCGPQCRVEDGW